MPKKPLHDDTEQLTPEQLEYADILCLPKKSEERKKRLENLDVSRMTLWRWEQKEEFKEEYSQRIRLITKQHMPDIILAMIKKAKKGSVYAMRLFFLYVEELKARVDIDGKIEHSFNTESLAESFISSVTKAASRIKPPGDNGSVQ